MKQELNVENVKKKVLVVDDHPIVCMGLACFVNQEGGLLVCSKAHNAHEALKAIEALQPDIAIVDITKFAIQWILSEMVH